MKDLADEAVGGGVVDDVARLERRKVLQQAQRCPMQKRLRASGWMEGREGWSERVGWCTRGRLDERDCGRGRQQNRALKVMSVTARLW